jgi:hypothetical protein
VQVEGKPEERIYTKDIKALIEIPNLVEDFFRPDQFEEVERVLGKLSATVSSFPSLREPLVPLGNQLKSIANSGASGLVRRNGQWIKSEIPITKKSDEAMKNAPSASGLGGDEKVVRLNDGTTYTDVKNIEFQGIHSVKFHHSAGVKQVALTALSAESVTAIGADKILRQEEQRLSKLNASLKEPLPESPESADAFFDRFYKTAFPKRSELISDADYQKSLPVNLGSEDAEAILIMDANVQFNQGVLVATAIRGITQGSIVGHEPSYSFEPLPTNRPHIHLLHHIDRIEKVTKQNAFGAKKVDLNFIGSNYSLVCNNIPLNDQSSSESQRLPKFARLHANYPTSVSEIEAESVSRKLCFLLFIRPINYRGIIRTFDEHTVLSPKDYKLGVGNDYQFFDYYLFADLLKAELFNLETKERLAVANIQVE